MKPIVTVITIVKNAEHTIERTIRSLLAQNFDRLQYIVIDGDSSDGTLEIINKYHHIIDVLVSEPDNGTSDAFNKALDYVEGKYVIWLAADDCFGSNFLSYAVADLEKSNADLFWGAMTMYSATGKCTGRLKQNTDIFSCLQNGKGLNFPSMMISRKYLELIGGLDLTLRYCNDIEWLLRAYSIKEPINMCSNLVSVHRDENGKVSQYFRSAAMELIEVYRQYEYSIFPLLKSLVIREAIVFGSKLKGLYNKW